VNGAYVHLLLDPFPASLEIVALVLLVLAAIWRSEPVRRAAFVLVVLAGVVTVPVFRSGAAARQTIRGVEMINTTAIDPHQEAAQQTMVFVMLSAVVSLFALIRYRGGRPVARWATFLIAFLAIIATASTTYTSLLGGRIRHPETAIRTR